MIISSFEGGIRPSIMQHKKGNISQEQGNDISTVANFDYVLNFIQNLINSSNSLQNLQPAKNNERVTDNIKSNQTSNSQLFQLVSNLENFQSELPNNIQNNIEIKDLINSKFEDIDKPQLQSLFKIMNNNEQSRDNILKYIPKEILEYFEKNFEKTSQASPQLNPSQIQSQISEISKSKQTDLKIIDTTSITKEEFDNTNLSVKLTNNGNSGNKEHLIEILQNELKDAKVDLPTFRDGKNIKLNIKQEGENINTQGKNNDTFKINETKNTNAKVDLPTFSDGKNIKVNIKQEGENINTQGKNNDTFKINETKNTNAKVDLPIFSDGENIKVNIKQKGENINTQGKNNDTFKINETKNTNAKVDLPTFSDGENIKVNIKQEGTIINQQLDNQLNQVGRSDLAEPKQGENRKPESKGNFDKVFQNNQEQSNNKENDILPKGNKSIFAQSNMNSNNIQIAEAQTQTQTFNNVRIEELPELTNKFMQIASKEGTIKANISLSPENLGMLFVQITMKDGGMTMTIKVEKSATLDKISSSIANLINNFNEQGLKVENIKLA
ncbi:MAG TPA: flagellar hook-length control protein FliK, partial [Candidatus Kapabacteria bacterium]|nr:flagellar hook-length control protein FliK [Candidatus Kapabacteria bacterium]